MADEASLRIVLEGDDAGAQPRGGRPSQQQGGPPSPSSRPAGKKEVEPETVFDAFLEVARKLADAIGGIFSKVGSTAANLASAFASVQIAAAPPILATAVPEPKVIRAAHAEATLLARPASVLPPPNAIPVPPPPNAIPVTLGPHNIPSAMAKRPVAELVPPPPTAQLVPPIPTAQRAPSPPTAEFAVDVIGKRAPPPLPPSAGKGAAAAATGTGGASAALGAAAGPAAVVFAAIAATKALYESMAGAVKGVGDFTASLISANSDVSANITNMAGAAESAADSLGYVGSAGKIAAAAIGALGKVMQAIDANVERYAGFNPQIAQAQAQAELRNVFGEFRRAAQVGPELVRYIEARTELQQRFEDTKIRILTAIMPAVMNGMAFFQNNILPMLEFMAGLLATMANAIPIGNQQQNAQLTDIQRLLQEMQQQGLDFPGNLVMQGGFPFSGNAGAVPGAGASPLPPMPAPQPLPGPGPGG